MTKKDPGDARSVPSGASNAPCGVDGSSRITSPTGRNQPKPDAAQALREDELCYRTLFHGMANGFTAFEVVRDNSGKPCDFTIIAANAAFGEIVGFEAADILERPMSEVLPQGASDWIDNYEAVATTGTAGEFEYFSELLNRHYGVSAFRSGENQIAVMFTDITDSKKQLEALQLSRHQYTNAQRVAQVGSWEADLETRHETWSDETYRILGYEKGEVTPGPDAVLARVHPEERGKFIESIKEAAKQRNPTPNEFRIMLPDGNIRHASSQIQRQENPDMGKKTLIGTISDLTQMKATEKALRNSEERFRSAMENLPTTFTIKSSDFRYLYVNRRYLEWHKTTASQVLGKTAGDFAEPEIADVIDSLDREVLGSGTNIEREIELTYPDGKTRTTIGMRFPIHDADGKIAAIGGYAIDITSRIEAERALKESEQRYRELIRSLPVPIIVHADNAIVLINARAAEVLGGSDTEAFLGRSIWDFVHPDSLQLAKMRVEQLFGKSANEQPPADRTLPFVEQKFIRLDGREITVEIAASTVSFGGRIASQVAFNDITKRKKADESARALQAELAHVARVRSLTEMGTNFAHELNQPLAAITNYSIGALRRIRSGGRDAVDMVRVLELVSEQAIRAGDIIRRIRRFVASDETEFRPVDINDAIRETADLVHGDAVENLASVDLKLSESVPPVMGDVIQLQQAILILARNGIEAMVQCDPKSRILTIESTSDEAGCVEIHVRDKGPGFPPADVEKIFHPFQTTKPVGLGMGLAICRSIIEGHGGKITAESNQSSDTVFRISIPAG
jgi:PAS domain S-box-containing protein